MKKFYFIGALVCLLATNTFSQCVTPAPATITGPATVCGVQTVTYTASAVTGATGYSWTLPVGFSLVSWDGGRTITIKSPAAFAKAELNISVYSASCSSSPYKHITITGTLPDLSDSMSGPTQVLPGSTNVYGLPSIPGVSYSWVADGGSVVGGWGTNTVSVKAGSVNGYVRATLKNACGTGPVAKKFFTTNFNPNCASPAAITGPTYTLCGNKTVSYTASATPSATSYQWTLPVGFTLVSGQGTQTVTIKSPSTFDSGALQVAAIGSCGTSPARSLMLHGAPADFSAEMTGPTQVYSGSTNVYSIPASPVSNYLWSVDGGSVVGGWGTNSASIKAGTISGFVRVQVSNNCGSTVSKKAFTTTNCTSLKVTGTITDYVCQGGGGTITLNVTGGTAPYTYQWRDPNDNLVSTSKDVNVENGNYNVIVTSANGCTATESFFVYNEFPSLAPPYPITGPQNNLCGGKTVTYTATATPGATAYHWNVPAGFTVISGQGTRTITLKTPQTFTGAALRVSADVPCGNTGDRSPLYLIGTPSNYIGEVYGPSEVVAGSINDYNLFFYDRPISGISYSWVADGGSVVGGWGSANAQVKAGSISGKVKVMGTNSCGTGLIGEQAFTIIPAAAAVASSSTLEMLKTSFGVYPNPVHDQATVVFEGAERNQKYEIKVVDIYGKVLLTRQGTAVVGANTVQLTLGKYAKGIYMVNLITGDQSRTIKLLKGN
ncbi:MAG TPA: T9SS type A sorting domain-containing protein [Chryseolinea sp.]|nr:T9SS type A sorting domain-containing protein [Chryseolinea sp.]